MQLGIVLGVQVVLSVATLGAAALGVSWVRSAAREGRETRRAVEELGRVVARFGSGEVCLEAAGDRATVASPPPEALLDALRPTDPGVEGVPRSGKMSVFEAALHGMPADVLARIDALAAEYGLTREEMALEMASRSLARIESRARKQLRQMEPPDLVPPDEDDDEGDDEEQSDDEGDDDQGDAGDFDDQGDGDDAGDEDATRVMDRPVLLTVAKVEDDAGDDDEDERPTPVTERVRPPQSERPPITPTRVSATMKTPQKKK